MTIKVAINGFGRIGRMVLRAHYEGGKKHGLQFLAINDLGDAQTNAHLLKYDTAHARFPGSVRVDGQSMVVDDERIRVVAERDPAKLPWKQLGIDVVLECTGLFTSKARAGAHLQAGARKVIISAPGESDVDRTIVYDVNKAVKQASETDLKGLLEYTSEPLVSSDFNHHPASAILDAGLTRVAEGTLVKVCAWYDNEWGFSNRMLDATVALMNAK